jgi:hypothetical protein
LGFPFGVDGVEGTAPAALPKSNAVPGVLGVLLADPKDANAPVPRPNAEAPAVGEEIPAGPNGDIVLRGLDRPP